MREKIISFVVLLFVTMGFASAQTRFSGIVIDTDGDPVIGASILIKGTGQGTITDIDGAFTLSASKDATLVISYVGLLTQEVPVSNNMRVVLQSDSELLDEVVVVGYGTQRKENLTGAVSSVSVEDAVASRPVTDIAKALQGISPGLTITNNLGGVGTESNIRLRGSVGSINASGGTSPLVLVDGVEVPSLNLINPSDIESISDRKSVV